MILDFLNKPDKRLLFLNYSSAGLIVPTDHFPPNLKSKSTYFIKVHPVAVDMQNFRKVIVFGDISAKPIDELATLVEEVLIAPSSPRSSPSNFLHYRYSSRFCPTRKTTQAGPKSSPTISFATCTHFETRSTPSRGRSSSKLFSLCHPASERSTKRR